jgi:hypothetical protein
MLKANPSKTLIRHGDTVLGTHRVARVSQFLALVADPWVVGHAGDAGLVDLGV